MARTFSAAPNIYKSIFSHKDIITLVIKIRTVPAKAALGAAGGCATSFACAAFAVAAFPGGKTTKKTSRQNKRPKFSLIYRQYSFELRKNKRGNN